MFEFNIVRILSFRNKGANKDVQFVKFIKHKSLF